MNDIEFLGECLQSTIVLLANSVAALSEAGMMKGVRGQKTAAEVRRLSAMVDEHFHDDSLPPASVATALHALANLLDQRSGRPDPTA